MVHNLHKQQAPGRIIKNPTSARKEFGIEYGKSQLSTGMKNIILPRSANFVIRDGDSISRGPPCRQLVVEKEGKSTPETLPVGSSSTNPSVDVKCLFIGFANDCIFIPADIGRSLPTFYTRLTTKSNTNWLKRLAITNKNKLLKRQCKVFNVSDLAATERSCKC
ncbi:uncharacterized protein LOC121466842 [Drosophila elegans]|uniref:uncharacterized protein LOC121466842 n=1 Tax=Drosophila elegans TaxID=30023 RepID=UPI001BC83C5B|nr:uncharacterized protein LOC121466842 [Drosophila elegans]